MPHILTPLHFMHISAQKFYQPIFQLSMGESVQKEKENERKKNPDLSPRPEPNWFLRFEIV